jgi:hypothetical protein
MIASPPMGFRSSIMSLKAAELGGSRTQPNGIGTKCANAQEQAPRGRDLQSTLLIFGSFSKDPIRHLKQPRKGQTG